MKNITGYLSKHITSSILIIIYIVMVVLHLISDSFILSDQVAILLMMIPFTLYGFILDYILVKNTILNKVIRTLTALLPNCLFLLPIISATPLYNSIEQYDILSYLIWILLSLPLFITSFSKENLRQRTMHTLYGLAAIIVVYMFLTTQTTELDISYGATLYFITYFFLIFSASGIKRIPYLGTGLGILNAIALIIMRYYPITAAARMNGWDYYFMYEMETLIIITLVISLFARLLETIQASSTTTDK